MASAELDEFRRQIDTLAAHANLAPHIEGTEVRLAELDLSEIDALARIDAVYYFLLAAAGLNRTSLRREAQTEAKQQFTDALTHFLAVTNTGGSDLQKKYEDLNRELTRSETRASIAPGLAASASL